MALTSQTKTVKVHQIQVTRGGEGIITLGADYDLRILRAQHPAENVKVIEQDYDVIKIPDDAAHLHDQLCRKYDTKNVKIVGRVFPSPEQLAQFAGVTVRFSDMDPVAGPQKSVQRDHGREQRLADAKAAETGKPASKGGKGANPALEGSETGNLGDAAAVKA